MKYQSIKKYLNYFKQKESEWESLCINCGGCCGAYDDPCVHLKKNNSGKSYCEIFDIHPENVGWLNGKPVIFDFLSAWFECNDSYA